MASPCEHVDPGDQTVPNGGETRREEEEDGGGGEGGGEEEGEGADVKNIQSHYLRCASPNLSMLSESRFSMISGSDADSIYMEPIHLSSAIAAKKIINEQLPPRGVRVDSVPESMLESAEQLMVEDLYNRVKDMIDDRSPYNTPCVMDIQRAMVQDRLEAPLNPVDEVWPNIFIAEKSVAVNKARLKRMGITHIINAAHGTGVYTGASFYAGIQYLGIEVDDFPDSDISLHFRTTAEFLDEALLTHKGKVLVDSMMGVSRSAVLVAAYLMIFHSMSIMEALGTLRKKRAICPNEGFLKQLREFNETLMEERDDDDDTLSQCSVIDARARARIFGEVEPEEDEDEDTDEDEEQSMVGVKAHSIMMEEEGDDTASLMSSVASSAAAAALKSGMIAARARAENPAGSTEVVGEELALPVSRESGGGEGGEEDEEEDGVGSMIREWQRRNEKYQSDEWWEAQLNSEAEGDDLDSLLGGKGAARSDADGGDLESITSEDVRAVKERVKRRNRRGPPSEAASTSSCTSYADLWKQRLREIEEQAAARYRKKDLEEESESDAGAPGGLGGAAHRRMDDEVASIMSDSSSMYNFCQKNKEKLTPLERWRVKRIQFGWNKKGEDGDGSSVVSGLSGASGETEARPSPSLEDVNMTAYQTWKLKQQKRLGEDGNKDEVLEMSRVVDDSGKAKRRQQRREEVMERSRKNLEESQSMCGGWESESCVSGGSAIPLSAFWAGAGVATGPPSVANNNDDNVSMLSGRSSNISSVSQARSVRSAHPMGPTPPICPILPVPTVMGPGGEPMVNLASIQNWIASVVSETLVQRQNEMMSLPPPSSAGSVLGYGGGGASSVVSGRGGDDRRSVLSGAPSYASDLSRARAAGGRAESVLSGSRFSSASSGVRSTLDSTSVASKKKQITTTSVPLFSLFQDQVDLKKLDSMEKEIKSEFRDKMATYEKKKILEDNKRSTLYKKKKPKEDEDEEEADERKRREEEFLEEAKKKVEKPKRSYGLSGCLNLSTALEKGKETNIDDWLRSVRPPPRKPTDGTEADPPEDPYYDDLDASASEFGFSNRRASYAIEEEEEEGYGGGRSRYRSSPEPLYRRTPLDAESPPSNGFSRGYGRAGRSNGALPDEGGEGTDGGYSDLSTKRKYGHLSRHHEEGTETEARPNRRVEAEADAEEEDVEAFIAQTRQRIRARALAEAEDDEVLSAWREQQETKSRSKSEES